MEKEEVAKEEKKKKNNQKGAVKNLLKVIGLLIILTIIIFIIITARKVIILNNLENKIVEYSKIDNYYVKNYDYYGETLVIGEYYVKGDKNKTELNSINSNSSNKLIEVYNGEKFNMYIESNGDKTALLDAGENTGRIAISNFLEVNNFQDILMTAIMSEISTENCNGKECYRIQTNYDFMNRNDKESNVTIYIDKETGLPTRYLNGTRINKNEKTSTLQDFYYEFNMVTDEDVQEPDISEYKIPEED